MIVADFRVKQGFFIITTVCVALSLWLSRYIPAGAFEEILSPLLFTITVTVAFFGSFLVFKHADGLRIRRVWGWTLLIWGLIDFIYLVSYIFARSQVMDISAQHISTIELLLGNLLGWVLLLYPTEAVRPGWLSVKTGLWQVLPMYVLIGLDYLIPLSLRPLLRSFRCFLPISARIKTGAKRISPPWTRLMSSGLSTTCGW